MPSGTRTSIYLKPEVYRALKDKAAITHRSVLDLVNAAVLESLREDILDLKALDSRVKEQTRPFVEVLKEIM